jgi:hypothetical protein
LLETDDDIRQGLQTNRPGQPAAPPAAWSPKQPHSPPPSASPYRPTLRPPVAILTALDDGKSGSYKDPALAARAGAGKIKE